MGCGASKQQSGKKYRRRRDDTSSWGTASTAGQRSERGVSYAPTGRVNTEDIGADLQEVYDQEDLSDGEEASESPTITALKAKKTVLGARILHGINADPNQFEPDDEEGLSSVMHATLLSYLDDHIQATLRIQIAEENGTHKKVPQMPVASDVLSGTGSNLSFASSKSGSAVPESTTSSSAEETLKPFDKDGKPKTSHFYLPNVSYEELLDVDGISNVAARQTSELFDAPLGRFLLNAKSNKKAEGKSQSDEKLSDSDANGISEDGGHPLTPQGGELDEVQPFSAAGASIGTNSDCDQSPLSPNTFEAGDFDGAVPEDDILQKTVTKKLLRETDNARGSAWDRVALAWLDSMKEKKEPIMPLKWIIDGPRRLAMLDEETNRVVEERGKSKEQPPPL